MSSEYELSDNEDPRRGRMQACGICNKFIYVGCPDTKNLVVACEVCDTFFCKSCAKRKGCKYKNNREEREKLGAPYEITNCPTCIKFPCGSFYSSEHNYCHHCDIHFGNFKQGETYKCMDCNALFCRRCIEKVECQTEKI